MRILILSLLLFSGMTSFSFSDKDQMVRVRVLSGQKQVIKRIDFQTYLAGVVENEMPMNWPIEALKAQVVVARSYALTKIKENKNKDYDLDSTIMDQVYKKPKSALSLMVVQDTQQVVLKTTTGDILKAFYHADCGGQTVSASDVWGSGYDSGTTTDSWCAARDSNRWSYSIKKENMLNRLATSSSKKLDLWAEFFNDRIKAIKVNEQMFSVQKLRQIFGFSKIRNSPTSILNNVEEIVFQGQGYGHGVGLCQWGSMEQAKQGKDYFQILSHYYPKAQVETAERTRVASRH